MRRWMLLLRSLAPAAAFLLPGCETVGFLAQGVAGQWEVLRRARPNEAVLADPATPELVRERLVLVGELRAFARERLALPADEAYGRYAELGREHLVYVVHAAPEFSLEPKSWWYPVVGRQDYRGYFAAEGAEERAAQLRREGCDVCVDGVDVFSTLGWFHDPVLDTFIDYPELALAENLFHELAHHRLYVAGATDYNEAFATAVGREGVRRWLRARGETARLAAYERTLRRRTTLHRTIERRARELETLYASGLPAAIMRRRKAETFGALRCDVLALRDAWSVSLSGWLTADLNNAHIVAAATYDRQVPWFEQLLADCDGELPAFYRRVAELAPRRGRQGPDDES